MTCESRVSSLSDSAEAGQGRVLEIRVQSALQGLVASKIAVASGFNAGYWACPDALSCTYLKPCGTSFPNHRALSHQSIYWVRNKPPRRLSA